VRHAGQFQFEYLAACHKAHLWLSGAIIVAKATIENPPLFRLNSGAEGTGLSNPRATRNAELGWPTGDQPGEIHFQYEPTWEARDAILRALSPAFPPAKSPDAALLALTPPEGVAGRYRLGTPEGEWFVRVSTWLGDAALEQTLVDYLANERVPVNPFLVAGVTLDWEGRIYRVDVRGLIHGRHFDNSPEDVKQATTALVASHGALLSFPQADTIRATATERYQQFDGARARIAAALRDNDFGVFIGQETWAAEHRDWLAAMAHEFEPRFDLLPGAQCVHGQVHPGNVLFTADGRAVLVDWEEAVHNYAPPAFDLAYFVQRFCLRDDPTPDVLRQRLDTITAHYGPLPPLAEMMRQLAWLSIAAIVDFQQQGIVTPISEYEKFVRLEWQARALVGVV
jgi:Ser/Thr protein kinase RdoA (MazF antagonist)